jgi:hypothetical protein
LHLGGGGEASLGFSAELIRRNVSGKDNRQPAEAELRRECVVTGAEQLIKSTTRGTLRVAAAIWLVAAVGATAWAAPGKTPVPASRPANDGPVSAEEIAAFKRLMMTSRPPANGSGNVWVFGGPGKAIEACGLMFEATGDRAILDRMIDFCDAALAGRNDLATFENGGQRTTWTGKIDPVWPPAHINGAQQSVGAAIETGSVLGHIAFCARLILETKALANQPVTGGDRHRFGATYRKRALKYIAQCDHVIDAWILPRFIRDSDHKHIYFAGPPNRYKPGQPAPWNQMFMVTNGLIRFAQCHDLLKDDPTRVARYDAIVKPNIEWFLTSAKRVTSPAGSACRVWLYSLATPNYIEDTNHAAYDSEGVWIAWSSGRYGLTREDVMPYANTFVDVVMANKNNGRFAGRVTGTTGKRPAGGDNYVRDEYLYLADIRPDAYEAMAKAEIDSGKFNTSLPIMARMLWLKDKKYKARATNEATKTPGGPE